MYTVKIITASVFLLLTATVSATQTAKVVYTSAESIDKSSYYVQLLELLFSTTQDKYGDYQLIEFDMNVNQERQIKIIQAEMADLMWTMTTDERERRLLPIRFALLKGLMGKRVFVILKNRQKDFPLSLKESELKKKVAIQGLNWPDYKILRSNGYRVETVDWGDWYENLFAMIKYERVDYFPRSVIEASIELKRRKNAKLAIEQNHLIEYPAYLYFFVGKHRPELVQRLNDGFEIISKNGEFDKLFNSFEANRKAQSLLNLDHRIRHKLTNPLLSYSLQGLSFD